MWKCGSIKRPKGVRVYPDADSFIKILDPSVQTLNPLDMDYWLRANRKHFKGGTISHCCTKNGC